MSTTRPEPSSARGFSIIAALFILVVLAGLGGFILSTSATQHLSQAQDVQNIRAMRAARAGIEWATYQVTRATAFRDDPVTGCTNAGAGYAGAVPATQVFLPGALPGLDEFRVDVVCRSQSFAEAGSSDRVFQIVATACTAAGGCPATSPPALGYVEHRQTATVRQ